MNETNIPYSVMLAATKGEVDAIRYILKYYEAIICSKSLRRAYRPDSSTYLFVDPGVRHYIETELIKQISKFKFR